MTLVELTVTLAILVVIMGALFSLFGVFSTSAANSRTLTASQENVHSVLRVLEADVRSADPLINPTPLFTGTPPAFPWPTGPATNSGANGTTPTDVIALEETTDSYSPCTQPLPTTTLQVPSPFPTTPYTANVVWAYDPTAQTLTRYSYCVNDATPSWKPGMTLDGVVNASGTMFTLYQDFSSGTLLPQATTPSSTTAVNQGAPGCGSSLSTYILVKSKGQTTAYNVRLAVSLPNQSGVEAVAC